MSEPQGNKGMLSESTKLTLFDFGGSLDNDEEFLSSTSHRKANIVMPSSSPEPTRTTLTSVSASDNDPLNAAALDESGELDKKEEEGLGSWQDYEDAKIAATMSYIADSGIHMSGSKTNELDHLDLEGKQKEYVWLMEHTDEWFTMMDISFILSRAFRFVKETRGTWWGHGTNRTLVVPSSVFSQLEGIVKCQLKYPNVDLKTAFLALDDLYRYSESGELLVIDVTRMAIALDSACKFSANTLLEQVFSMSCVDFQSRCEACIASCRLSVLMRDPMKRMRLRDFIHEAVEAETLTSELIIENEPCWCPNEKKNGMCEIQHKGCVYVHQSDSDKIEREEEPRCPSELLGYLCEKPGCKWRHDKAEMDALLAAHVVERRTIYTDLGFETEKVKNLTKDNAGVGDMAAFAAQAQRAAQNRIDEKAEEAKKMEAEKPAEPQPEVKIERQANVVPMRLPSYLRKKKPAPKAAAPVEKKVYRKKFDRNCIIKATRADMNDGNMNVLGVLTDRQKEDALRQEEAEKTQQIKAERAVGYMNMVDALASKDFGRMFEIASKKQIVQEETNPEIGDDEWK